MKYTYLKVKIYLKKMQNSCIFVLHFKLWSLWIDRKLSQRPSHLYWVENITLFAVIILYLHLKVLVYHCPCLTLSLRSLKQNYNLAFHNVKYQPTPAWPGAWLPIINDGDTGTWWHTPWMCRNVTLDKTKLIITRCHEAMITFQHQNVNVHRWLSWQIQITLSLTSLTHCL